MLAHVADGASHAPEQLAADAADAFGLATSTLIHYLATHAEDGSVGVSTLRTVAPKHLPALLGHAAAAAPLAVACSSHRWLKPIAQRALETHSSGVHEQGAPGTAEGGGLQGDPLTGALLRAPHGATLVTALAEEAGAAVANEAPDDALGAITLVQAMRVKQLPPAALAALLPLVDASEEGGGEGPVREGTVGALQQALESLLPVGSSLHTLQLVGE